MNSPGCVPKPYTLYRGIRSLPAAGSLWINNSGQSEHKYWYDLTAELAEAKGTPGNRLPYSVLDCPRPVFPFPYPNG